MLSDDSAPAPFVLTSQSLLSKRQEFTLHAKQYKTETILSHQHDFLNNINPKRNSNPNANNNNNTNSATTDEDVDRLVGFAEEEKENSCGDFSVSSTSSVQHNPHPVTTRRLLEEEEERARALPTQEEGSNVTPPCDLENNKLTGDSASFDLLHCEAYVSNHRPYIHHHDNNESSPTSNYVSPDGNVYGKPFFCKGDSCPTAPLPHMESNMTLDKAKSEFYSVLPASETDKEEDLGDDPPNLSNTNHNNNNNNNSNGSGNFRRIFSNDSIQELAQQTTTPTPPLLLSPQLSLCGPTLGQEKANKDHFSCGGGVKNGNAANSILFNNNNACCNNNHSNPTTNASMTRNDEEARKTTPQKFSSSNVGFSHPTNDGEKYGIFTFFHTFSSVGYTRTTEGEKEVKQQEKESEVIAGTTKETALEDDSQTPSSYILSLLKRTLPKLGSPMHGKEAPLETTPDDGEDDSCSSSQPALDRAPMDSAAFYDIKEDTDAEMGSLHYSGGQESRYPLYREEEQPAVPSQCLCPSGFVAPLKGFEMTRKNVDENLSDMEEVTTREEELTSIAPDRPLFTTHSKPTTENSRSLSLPLDDDSKETNPLHGKQKILRAPHRRFSSGNNSEINNSNSFSTNDFISVTSSAQGSGPLPLLSSPPPPPPSNGIKYYLDPTEESKQQFHMTAHPHIIRNIPRGKVPVEQGHSMRDWSQRTYEKVSEQKKTHTPSYRSNRLSIEEVRQHNTPEDLWIVIHNVVYDCTEFVRYHPGGKKLLYACGGREATAVYDAFHPWINCETMMEGYAVGVVDNKL